MIGKVTTNERRNNINITKVTSSRNGLYENNVSTTHYLLPLWVILASYRQNEPRATETNNKKTQTTKPNKSRLAASYKIQRGNISGLF